MQDNVEDYSAVSESAAKIYNAATELFAEKGFKSVSIKEISNKSNVNSALISYYFRGKKKLYEKILNDKADVFIEMQDSIRALDKSPIDKLMIYVNGIADLQNKHPYYIHLIFRELLEPQTMFEGYIKKRLYKIHQFMAELVQEAQSNKQITANVLPTHVAFTLEGIIMFFFMMNDHVRSLGNFHKGEEITYLVQAVNNYLLSLEK